MACNFIPRDRDQDFLLPPSVAGWLPEGHMAWFVLDAVEGTDLGAFYAKYRTNGQGGAAWHPRVMAALLLYAYCHGERSSRKIEKLCEESVPHRVITGNAKPDHCSISRFRKGHAAARMLAAAEATDAEEDEAFGKDRRGDELPGGLRSRRDRLSRLREARGRLERKRLGAGDAQREKLEERKRKEEETGRKMRGQPPMSVEEVSARQMKRKANATAPGTRITKTRSGYVQGFNAQAVCTDDQIILAAEVIDQENDQGQYHPMMEQAQANATAVLGEDEGKIGLGRADAGYCNAADLERECEYEMLMATTKDWKRRKAPRESPPPRGRMPKGLSATERMERKLGTKRGSAEYRWRSRTIEPVFGQIK